MRESLTDRAERLSTGGRLREADALLTDVEATAETPEGDFNGLSMLILDAIRDGDEYALELLLVRLQRIYGLWVDDAARAEARGRLRGFADVCSTALESVVSLDVISSLEPDSHAHRFLAALEEQSGLSNNKLSEELGADAAGISRIGSRLHDAGLARKRRYGRRNAWDITPRGLKALEVLNRGELPRYRRPHRAAV
jgi:hypothetical protein